MKPLNVLQSDCCKSTDVGLLLIRVIVGGVLAAHGSQKLFGAFGGPGMEGFISVLDERLGVPFPVVSGWLAALAEFGGGVLLVVGLFARLVTVPMAFTMLVAAFTAHGGAFFLPAGMEYALTLAVVLIGLGLTGPGRFSIDGCMSGACKVK